ncbi:MAG: A24 family peptidase [Methylocella sp.]
MNWLSRATPCARRLAPWSDQDLVKYCFLAAVGCAMAIASLASAPGRAGWFGAALALLMLAIAVVDAHRFIIPNGLSLAALLLALANASEGSPQEMSGVVMALLRGVVLGLAFLALREIYRRLRGRQGIGLGDVKLAVVAGAWLDWTLIPVAIELAALSALAVYGVRQLVHRRSLRLTVRLPFGLFFAPAIWLCWLLDVRVLQF